MIANETTLNRIWKGCLQHDRHQQELFYKLLAPRMLTACIYYATDRDEAQDIMQEGFVKVFRHMHKYRGQGSLTGWIRRIMVHVAISYYRKQKPVVLTDQMSDDMVSTCCDNHNLEVKDLLQLINQLPDNYRQVFNLYAIEGYSHWEISETLGISTLVSRATLYRARGILKNKLSRLQERERFCLTG